jgi:sulfate-transporting ATPase
MPGRRGVNSSRTVLAALSGLNLEAEVDRSPSSLPLGRRRLVGLGRAVVGRPSVLLLDEPASGLSDEERRQLRQLLRRICDTWHVGILLIEHDVSFVLGVCDRIAVLNFGSLIACGAPSDIRRAPAVIEAYLGRMDSDGPHDDRQPLSVPESWASGGGQAP